ncbi:bladder cancer associated transcript 1 isoform X3 [Anas platyrhynchos]|uniref:bladder cancer associated transcript 1 isoform X3 n=1 Tax=Anas platyrhynchos TaxID=8839 RepID=UPI003AF2B63E
MTNECLQRELMQTPRTSLQCGSPPLPTPAWKEVSWGVPTPLLLRGMPQFTFACFCGLHGFCKMKRKKEESSAEQETAV